jgi:uncharacterized surface protein with fasciclin (FAS1) repeats
MLNSKMITAGLVATGLSVFAFSAYASECSASKCDGGSTVATAYSKDAKGEKTQPATVVAALAGKEKFSTLVAAVKAAGLADTLSSEGPFTVFAPTNEAFAKLPAGTVDELLKPENKEKLKAVLTYHVVAGKVTSEQVVKLSTAKTVNGAEIAIKVVDGKVLINNATVIKADYQVGNGVIHVIDSVILPPAQTTSAQ